MNKSDAPQIISLSAAELEKLLGELRGPLAPATYQMVEALLRTLQWVMATLEQKTATLGRLGRRLMAVASAGMLLAFTSASSAAERQMLRGHVPAAVAKLNLPPIGRLPATNRLNLAIGLPLRNTNALSKLLQDLYDPASPQFRH